MGLHPLGIDARVDCGPAGSTRIVLASSAVSTCFHDADGAVRSAWSNRQSDRITEWCVARQVIAGIMPAIIASEGLDAATLIARTALVTRYMLWQGINAIRIQAGAVEEAMARCPTGR